VSVGTHNNPADPAASSLRTLPPSSIHFLKGIRGPALVSGDGVVLSSIVYYTPLEVHVLEEQLIALPVLLPHSKVVGDVYGRSTLAPGFGTQEYGFRT
jgi:hypothetical protein